MKIAISVIGKTLASTVDSRFGRCPNFLIVDSKTNEVELLENTAGQFARGVGVSAAQMLVNAGVKGVIAGNFGPNAVRVLTSAGVIIVRTDPGVTAKEALEQFKKEEV